MQYRPSLLGRTILWVLQRMWSDEFTWVDARGPSVSELRTGESRRRLLTRWQSNSDYLSLNGAGQPILPHRDLAIDLEASGVQERTG